MDVFPSSSKQEMLFTIQYILVWEIWDPHEWNMGC